jgi:hypothetical protein
MRVVVLTLESVSADGVCISRNQKYVVGVVPSLDSRGPSSVFGKLLFEETSLSSGLVARAITLGREGGCVSDSKYLGCRSRLGRVLFRKLPLAKMPDSDMTSSRGPHGSVQ